MFASITECLLAMENAQRYHVSHLTRALHCSWNYSTAIATRQQCPCAATPHFTDKRALATRTSTTTVTKILWPPIPYIPPLWTPYGTVAFTFATNGGTANSRGISSPAVSISLTLSTAEVKAWRKHHTHTHTHTHTQWFVFCIFPKDTLRRMCIRSHLKTAPPRTAQLLWTGNSNLAQPQVVFVLLNCDTCNDLCLCFVPLSFYSKTLSAFLPPEAHFMKLCASHIICYQCNEHIFCIYNS